MVTTEQIREKLDTVALPGMGRSVAMLNLIRDIEVTDSFIKVTLASSALDPDVQQVVKSSTEDAIKGLPDTQLQQVIVDFVEAEIKDINQIGKVLAVVSGKGGVGKSLVSSLLAIALARNGLNVGILDADVTGPSIPKMFGITNRPMGTKSGILPVLSKTGIEIMSINLLLPNEDDAVIWRGPIISNTIKQFWEDVLWGNLDYLIVDLPPGTADAPLTVMQSLPVSGVIIVSTPQELAQMVVRKAIQMVGKMNVPVLGVVENMSYLVLPDSGKRMDIFGPSKASEMAKEAGRPLLGQLPIDPELARLCDDGLLENYDADAFKEFSETVMRVLQS